MVLRRVLYDKLSRDKCKENDDLYEHLKMERTLQIQIFSKNLNKTIFLLDGGTQMHLAEFSNKSSKVCVCVWFPSTQKHFHLQVVYKQFYIQTEDKQSHI